MTVLSRALQIRKGLSNVGRMREISSAVTRFGFGELLVRVGIGAPKEIQEDGQVKLRSAPERLRLLFESLGPTFIKIGQLAAGRPDLVPTEYIRELQRLQDKVETVPYSVIKDLVETSLGKKIEDLFSSFDTLPLASASIAQVHAARTLTGEDVVLKIQKPSVDRILHKDFEILEMIAELAEATIPEASNFNPLLIVKEFKRLLLQEIDFEREARTIERYQKNFSHSEFLVVPRVYKELSTKTILTMERIQGFRITDMESMNRYSIDAKALLKKGLDHHMESLMVHGLFHADPHAGNMLVLPDGRLALLDFGSVGWLSPKSRSSLINLFLSLISQDYDALVEEYLELSPRSGKSHSTQTRDQLSREVSLIMAPYYGVSLNEIPAAEIMLEVSGLAFKYQIQLPQDLIAVFKSNMILEGIGRQIDPDFDLLDSAARFSKKVIQQKIKPQGLLKAALRSSRDIQRFVQKGPRLGLEIMRQIEAGQFEVKLKSSEWERMLEMEAFRQRVMTFSVFFLGSVILLGFLLQNPASNLFFLHLTEFFAGGSAIALLLTLLRRK